MGLDYYGLLDLNRNATDEDIKKEFRRLSLKFHPQRNDDPNSAKRFHDICEAYDVLRSPKWKALYDQFGEDGIKNGVPVPPGPNEEEGPIEVYTFHGDEMKVFRDFFGVDNPFADYYLPNLDPGYKFFEEPAKPIPGPDQEHTFELSLEDAFYGTTKSVGIPLQVVDETGTRTVEVDKMFTFRVPKGTTDGHCFYFKSAGTSGPNILPGDVTFRAKMKAHPEFKLEGHDFVVSKTIHLAYALTGCVVDVTTFDGKIIHIPIHDVVKPKHRICLKGEGMPVIGFACRGDLIVEFEIQFPNRLSVKQKELIKQAMFNTS